MRKTDVYAEKLAIALRRVRKQRNMTQKDLADLTKLGLNTIKSYESGTRWPRKDQQLALAYAFGLNSLNDLIQAQPPSPTDKLNLGWQCPKCSKVNAPWVPSCDCHKA